MYYSVDENGDMSSTADTALFVSLEDNTLFQYLIEKYNVEICDNIKDKVFFQEGETKIINKNQ